MSKKNNERKINFKYNLSEYWNFLNKYKFLFFFLLFIVLIVEILFVADKFLFKIIIDNGTEFLDGIVSLESFVKILITLSGIFILVLIIRTLGKWLSISLLNVLEGKLILDVKKKYFNHIINLSYNFHTTHKTGSLISRLNRGRGAIANMTDILIFRFAPLIFQLIIVGSSLMYFNLNAGIVVGCITLAFISYSFFIQNIQQKSKLDFNYHEDAEKGFISDVFTNIDSIKYFGKEIWIKNKFSNVANKTTQSMLKYWSYYKWFEAGHVLILGVGTFLLIYFPLMSFLNKEISLGTLVFIFTIYGNLVQPMFGFVSGMRGFYRASADFQELFEYGKIKNEIRDKPHAKKLQIKNGEIEFNNVSFNYGKKRAFLLDNFNLKINKNEKVAFIGHTGCGKTTLVKLLYRLYDIPIGEILIDGKNIKDFNQKSLREGLSIVPQECVLFNDTLLNNIKFSNPKASREEVWKAIKFAQLDKFINNLPDKEKTLVGERGVKLSGGEKQRVSIARAILADKKILVLDEATSSLDSETEHEIQCALSKLLKGRSSIIIAHRLSTIMSADRIVVIKKGKIVQEGKHEDLIKQKGEYKKLWDFQKGGYLKDLSEK